MAGSAADLGFDPNVLGTFGGSGQGMFDNFKEQADARKEAGLFRNLDLSDPASLKAKADELVRMGRVSEAMQLRARAEAMPKLENVSANAARARANKFGAATSEAKTEHAQRAEVAEKLRLADRPNLARSVLQGHMTVAAANVALSGLRTEAQDEAEDTGLAEKWAKRADEAGMPDIAEGVRDGTIEPARVAGLIQGDKSKQSNDEETRKVAQNDNIDRVQANIARLNRAEPAAAADLMASFGLKSLADAKNLTYAEAERFAAYSGLQSVQFPTKTKSGGYKLTNAPSFQREEYRSRYDGAIEDAMEDAGAEGYNDWVDDNLIYTDMLADAAHSLSTTHEILPETAGAIVMKDMLDYFEEHGDETTFIGMAQHLDQKYMKGDLTHKGEEEEIPTVDAAGYELLEKGQRYINATTGAVGVK